MDKQEQEAINKAMSDSFIGEFVCLDCDKRLPVAHDSLTEFLKHNESFPTCCGYAMSLAQERNSPMFVKGSPIRGHIMAYRAIDEFQQMIDEAKEGDSEAQQATRMSLVRVLKSTPNTKMMLAVADFLNQLTRKHVDQKYGVYPPDELPNSNEESP